MLGLVCSLLLVQQNDRFKSFVVDSLITELQKAWDAEISVKNKYLNLFTLSVVLEDGSVVAHRQPKTTWSFKQAKITVCLIDLLFKNQATLALTLDDVASKTVSTTAGIELIDHLKDILTPRSMGVPVAIESLVIRDGLIQLTHGEHVFDFTLNGDFSFSRTIQNGALFFQNSIIMENSGIALNGKSLIDGLDGSTVFYKADEDVAWTMTLHHTFKHFLGYRDRQFLLTGSWAASNKNIMLREDNHLVDLSAVSHSQGFKLDGGLPFEVLMNFLDYLKITSEMAQHDISGQCSVDLLFDRCLDKEFSCSGEILIDAPKLNSMSSQLLAIKNLTVDKHAARADFVFDFTSNISSQGAGTWDFEKKQGAMRFVNNREIVVARRAGSPVYWSLLPEAFELNLQLKEDPVSNSMDVQGRYQLALQNSITPETKKLDGSLRVSKKNAWVEGSAEGYDYFFEAAFEAQPHIKKISCMSPYDAEPLIKFDVLHDDAFTLHGYTKYAFIQAFLPLDLKDKVVGKENKFFLDIRQDSFSCVKGSLSVSDGKLFLPSIQNMIKQGYADFTIDIVGKKIFIDNGVIKFARGEVQIPHGYSVLSADAASIKELYLPLSVNNLLINVKRDFYSFIYGNLLAQYNSERPMHVGGSLVLQKTLVQGDVFGDAGRAQANPLDQLQALNSQFDFSIRVLNERPILVKTPTIDALAHIDLQASHKKDPSIEKLPDITGTVSIDSGCLKFFENSLKIEYGKIQFLTQQLDDPVIDLIAKNRINKYIVTLQIAGSLKKPTVILEATPELSEEQVLGLLFTGSENSTLQADLSAMVMQSINTLLLGNFKPYDKTAIFLDTIAKPLKYVQITPDFADPSGRGGLRAQVSVPLGKQVKAQFQKNLSFDDEELSVEIDYLISDDINFKIVKDHRGELGSEVEVRFKF